MTFGHLQVIPRESQKLIADSTLLDELLLEPRPSKYIFSFEEILENSLPEIQFYIPQEPSWFTDPLLIPTESDFQEIYEHFYGPTFVWKPFQDYDTEEEGTSSSFSFTAPSFTPSLWRLGKHPESQ